MAAFGLSQAGTYPNLGKVTRSWFPLTIRTTVQGAVASLSGRAGGACASLVVATLLAVTLRLNIPVIIGTVLLVGALTFVPALALGPIVEHLTLWGV